MSREESPDPAGTYVNLITTISSLGQLATFGMGPIPDDLLPGYLAAAHIAQTVDSLSTEHLRYLKGPALRTVHLRLKSLVFGKPGKDIQFIHDEVFQAITENTQELNSVRDRPVSYHRYIYPNAHLVCFDLWEQMMGCSAWCAKHLGVPDVMDLTERHGQGIRDYFLRYDLPGANELLAELQLEVSKVVQRRLDKPKSREVAAEPQRQLPMTVEQANATAEKLVRKFGKAFFVMSKTKQAGLIGCHHLTWEQTELFKTAAQKGHLPAAKPRAKKTVSLTNAMEAVTGEGGRDETCHEAAERELRRLKAEQAADHEPSPLEDDPPGRERKVHFGKRL